MSLLNDIFTLRRMNDLRSDILWPTVVTPPPPTYTVTGAASSINEGSALTVNVSGLNIINGTYYWTIDSNAGDFSTSSGSFTITSNAGSFTVTPAADATTESAETFTVSIRSGSTSGTILSTSGSLTINDTSTTPVVPTIIGEAWGGGYYGGKISYSGNGVATHYLIVSPKSTEILGKRWAYTFNENTNSAADSNIDGLYNTTAMYNNASEVADYVRGLTTGGYSDWYCPSRYELEVLYYFLKPQTASNNTGGGPNPYAVSPEPINTYYTAGSPAQTSATAFRQGGGQHFEPSVGQPGYPYWSSTEQNDGAYAFYQQFDSGTQGSIGKSNTSCLTRAIRRIPV
jgi:hypothetical protein